MATEVPAEVAVARVAEIQSESAQILGPGGQARDRSSETLVLAIGMQCDAALLAENPGQMPGRGSNFQRDAGKPQSAVRVRTNP